MDRKELGQSLNLSVEMIAEGRPNRSGKAIIPRFITVHNTSNPNAGADARAHSRFVRETGFYMIKKNGVEKKNYVSWHYTVDDQRVLKHLPIHEHAIHAGAANSKSIAIETCMHQGIDQAAADLRVARLVAALMFDLGLGIDAVKPHKFWTGKNCPILLLADWEGFLKSVGDIRASLTPSPQPFALNSEEAEFLRETTPETLSVLNAGADLDDTGDIDHAALASAMAPA